MKRHLSDKSHCFHIGVFCSAMLTCRRISQNMGLNRMIFQIYTSLQSTLNSLLFEVCSTKLRFKGMLLSFSLGSLFVISLTSLGICMHTNYLKMNSNKAIATFLVGFIIRGKKCLLYLQLT